MTEGQLKRWMDKIVIGGGPDGRCWLWVAAKGSNGYGMLYCGRESEGRGPLFLLPHRLAYEHFVGPIPEGLVIDHLCEVRCCVNPSHLEAVTYAENNRRAFSGITACPKGHEYTTDNSSISPRGHRHCRTCAREAMKEKRRQFLSVGLTAEGKPRRRRTVSTDRAMVAHGLASQ